MNYQSVQCTFGSSLFTSMLCISISKCMYNMFLTFEQMRKDVFAGCNTMCYTTWGWGEEDWWGWTCALGESFFTNPPNHIIHAPTHAQCSLPVNPNPILTPPNMYPSELYDTTANWFCDVYTAHILYLKTSVITFHYYFKWRTLLALVDILLSFWNFW